jgi:hypothetical protein
LQIIEVLTMPSFAEQKKVMQDTLASTIKFGVTNKSLMRSTIDYRSGGGLEDTPKSVINAIKDQLCDLDDTLGETSPICWLPAKFYRLKKSSPELFDLDVDIYKPLSGFKEDSVSNEEADNDSEIALLLKSIAKDSAAAKTKQRTPTSRTKKSEKSARYVGSVASDPAVLALLHSTGGATQKKQKQKFSGRNAADFKPGKSTDCAQEFSAKSTLGHSATISSRDPRSQLPLIISPVKATSRKMGPLSSSRLLQPNFSARKNNSDTTFAAPEKTSSPKGKPLKGVASLLNLSELAKGLPRKGSLYKDDYNDFGLEKELRYVLSHTNAWIPRTEQTIINEKMSMDRKLRKMVEGKE